MLKPRNDTEQESDITVQARATLDKSLDDLDARTTARLQAIRKRTIADYRENSKGAQPRQKWIMSATALAATVVVAVLAVGIWQQSASDHNMMANLEDMSLLTDKEDFELYEELEFYQWLADEQSTS